MQIVSETKIRRDDYVLSMEWGELHAMIRERAEEKLRETGVVIPASGLSSAQGQIEIEMFHLSPNTFRAKVSVCLAPAEPSPVAPGTGPA